MTKLFRTTFALSLFVALTFLSGCGVNQNQSQKKQSLGSQQKKSPQQNAKLYRLIHEISTDDNSLLGIEDINKVNAEMWNYGTKQFMALNGIAYSSLSNSVKPPIWLDWITEEQYLAQQGIVNDTIANNENAQTCRTEANTDHRFLSKTTLPNDKHKHLRDSSGNLIRYETIISPKVVDYLDAHPTGPFNFPVGDPKVFGSMVLKLAWKELTIQDDAGRYFRHTATIKQQGQCQTTQVGLVAMHVMYKTKKQPLWIWSTFTQIDSAPKAEKNIRGKLTVLKTQQLIRKWTLYDPASNATLNQFGGDENNAKIGDQSEFEFARYIVADPDSNFVFYTSELQRYNADDYWQYYRQNGTQWYQNDDRATRCTSSLPTRRNGCVVPFKLSNTALEPYTQESSCLSCHNPNPAEDFLFFPAKLLK